ncbi:hypothetical protein CMI47_05100 [Candidatus Pacearchaeota archaeon]|jgi:hypothetical protein|nr:hypothetical protein [Candidatus Pacearchaeota archaeon]|tara:strand:- start:2987 stop:3313 length:327 start_codon:yes stop_codon:yes gene_type:complete
MTRAETISYPVQIWIAGDHAKAIETCRSYCDEMGFCVTVTPTTYVYTGGQEAGVCIGLINYGRFPSEPRSIFNRAREIGDVLLKALGRNHTPSKRQTGRFGLAIESAA